jgi:hypothetical protein
MSFLPGSMLALFAYGAVRSVLVQNMCSLREIYIVCIVIMIRDYESVKVT